MAPAAAAEERAASSTQIADLRRQAVSFEHGNGVPRDGLRAAALYCEAARLGDAASAFDLGWMYANARGVGRDDEMAASFFNVAAARGVAQAKNMLLVVGTPSVSLPACMVDPVAAEPERMVSAAVVAPFEAPVRAPKSIVELVARIAPDYKVPVPLIFAIMQAESNYNVVAVSPKNARGLMQLIPETAMRFRVKDVFDPAQNVRGGVAYLRWLLAYFEGEVSLVAAAYNAGERTVERYRGVPPYEETQAYVRRILSSVGTTTQPYDSNVAEPSPLLHQIRKRQEKRQ